MFSHETTRLDPEVRYLVSLTRAGLKPLSRWEAPLDRDSRRAIRREGMCVDTVERRTRFGRRVVETVFAKKLRYIDIYKNRYEKTRLRDTPGDVRCQGQLFGYPSCCVEAFAAEPYVPNGLDPLEQEILFHWACPSCHTTPGLVREYRRARLIYGDGRQVIPGRFRKPPRAKAGRIVGKVAASLALAAGTSAMAASAQNIHQAWVLDDGDRDGLSVSEEIRLGSNWHRADTDGDQVTDGNQLAGALVSLLNSSPWINVTDYAMMGIVTCNACGASVNMGYFVIANWLNGLSIQLNYIDLHAMENGCFTSTYRYCDGCGNVSSTVDVDLLKRVLTPDFVNPHVNPARAGDSDGDGLTDNEEIALGTDPGTGNDGNDLADELLDVITQLPRTAHSDRPYMLEHEMDGLEQCEICGSTFNMGMVEIVSPRDGMSVSMPFVALHALAHGGFTYDGTANDGEVLPLVLRTVLTANGSAHWVGLATDTDDDGLLDAEEAFFGLDSNTADEDGTQQPDGRELAARMAAKISILPDVPSASQTYVVHHATLGHYNCLVCGEAINMGFMEIVDPIGAKSVNVPYYSHHFMKKGSFSTDRNDLYPRVDPMQIGEAVGITSIVGIDDITSPPAFSFVNTPNPFGPGSGTEISLELPAAGDVELTIYNVEGRRVRKLFAGNVSGAQLRLRWDGTNDRGQKVGAGTYFCRARFGRVLVSRKMTLIR